MAQDNDGYRFNVRANRIVLNNWRLPVALLKPGKRNLYGKKRGRR